METIEAIGYDLLTLEQIKENMEEVAGRWNGDNPGLDEDRAHIALEAIEHINALKQSLADLQSYD